MIGHISLGTFIVLVVAGITYGIIMAIRDLLPHATPVIPKHHNFSKATEQVIEFWTAENHTTNAENLKKFVYNTSKYFIIFDYCTDIHLLIIFIDLGQTGFC